MPIIESVARSERQLGAETPKISLKQEGRVAPPLITKKWLCAYFGLRSNNTSGIYRKILTDDVLQQLGLSISEVRNKKFKMFTAVQSRHLSEILFG